MKIKELFKNLSETLIIELIKYVILFLLLNGGFYVILEGISKYTSLFENTLIFWIIIILFTVFMGIVLYQRFNRNIPYFPAINSDFQILELEINHIVNNKQEYIHTRRYKLKAKRNGLARYQGRFCWTGDSFQIKSGDDKHNVFLTKKVNTYDTYIVDFDRSYKKNEVIDVCIEWELKGEGSPFISTQIEEPTNKLILSVEFNRILKINHIEFQETYLQAAKEVLNHSNIDLKNHKVVQIINNPKLLHLYEISWKW